MDQPRFKDHFSTTAQDYGRYRPSYPQALFERLAALAPSRALAWDCGCGNGQASLGLVDHFDAVVATDASATQIENAFPHPKVSYRVAPAESSGLEPQSVSLVTVAQAIHWFDFEAFYEEVRRVAKPGGLLAAISYGLFAIAPGPDAVLHRLHRTTLGPYWPPERRYVDENLATIPFPFAEVDGPTMELRLSWSLDDLIGYIETWSSLQAYRRETGDDPLPAAAQELAKHWGDPAEKKTVRWPLNLRLGRLP